jgi:hypothetical protein
MMLLILEVWIWSNLAIAVLAIVFYYWSIFKRQNKGGNKEDENASSKGFPTL